MIVRSGLRVLMGIARVDGERIAVIVLAVASGASFQASKMGWDDTEETWFVVD